MCLAIPMRIVSLDGCKAVVAQSGVSRQVNVDLLPGVTVGEYVLVHAGFAIARVQEDEAIETLDLMREMNLQ